MRTSTTNRWKLGLFVSLGFVTIILALGWLGANRLRRETIDAYAYFDEEVSGLDVGAPVKFRGVPIGRVVRIRAAPDRRHVEVLSAVYVDSLSDLGLPWDLERRDPEQPFVPEDLRVQLVTSLLTGVAYIESDFFDLRRYPVPEYPFQVPWNTIHPAPSAYDVIEEGLMQAIDLLPRVSEQLLALLEELRGALRDAGISDLSEHGISLMQAAEQRVRELEDLSFVAEGARAMAELRALAADLRSSEGALQRTIAQYEKAGAHLQEALGESDLPSTMRSVRSFGARGGEAADSLVLLSEEARRDLQNLRATLDAVRRLAEMLEREPGALLRGRSPIPRNPADGR
jgi:hypothetical protein